MAENTSLRRSNRFQSHYSTECDNISSRLRNKKAESGETPSTPSTKKGSNQSTKSTLHGKSPSPKKSAIETPNRRGRWKTSQEPKSDGESSCYECMSSKSNNTLKMPNKRQSKKVIKEWQNNENQTFLNFEVDLERELPSIEEKIQKPTTLFDNEDVSGNCMYGFPTLAKKNAMTEKALLSRTSNIPRVMLEKIDDKSINDSLSPSQKFTAAKSTRSARKRPGHFSSESESVSEGNEFEPSSESDTCTEEENINSDVENKYEGNITPKKKVKSASKKVHVPITPCRRGRSKNKITYEDYHLQSEEYFQTQGEKILTSDHTLNKLKNRHLDEGKLQELLKNQTSLSESHKQGIYKLNENHKSMFPMWYQILEEGYSLLLYGLGSKRNLINDFHKEVISDYPTLIVNGFFPSLTIKDILDGIITELIETECLANPSECINIIEETMAANPENRLYVLIHNIDGQMLRSTKAQDVLSRLAAIENVHLVTSIDHINAPLIFDNVRRARYNFYWLDTTTLLPYEAETSYESSLLVNQSGALALSSLSNVFASLTTNAKAIYIILVKYQLEHGKKSTYSGMAFKDLYQSAREDFLVVSDAALRSHLTEFLDHKLVRIKRNIDGVEYLDIPLDNALLQKFIDDQSAE
ncbi:origin recognition complex subunit 2 isoform X2 [Chelonus insularis]|uniref:origin recognition complex subunit 2 isoform X2 n=1 Tax=Chelonus insularis TaxID=460826 RepID=UPI00158A6DA7|nr:origin recognition complex subunit 2 isoform X2 [Chelonus insularis]